MSNNKQSTEPMGISQTSSTNTEQGIYVEHLKKMVTMSNNKQSSIDWIIELLEEYGIDIEHLADEFVYAKMIHKDEILQAHAIGEVTGFGKANNPYYYAIKTPEKYYNETYGGEQ